MRSWVGARTAAILIVASVIALLAMALHWARPGYIVAQTDTFPMFDPFNYLAKTFWAWSDSQSPFGNFSIPSFSALLTLTGVTRLIAGESIGQALVNWTFLALQWLGAYFAARALGIRIVTAFAAAWCYTLSAYAQFYDVMFWTGYAFAAALPWILAALALAARRPELRARLTFAIVILVVTVLPTVGGTPQLFFEFVLVTIALAGAVPIQGSRWAFLRWCGSTATLAALASVWWLIPSLAAVFFNKITHATNPVDVAWTFARASFLNDLRFVPEWTWHYAVYQPYAKAYDADVAVYAAGFSLVAGLALALIACRGQARTIARWFGAISLVCLFGVKGMHPPLESLNEVVYRIPGFFLLIETAGLCIAPTLLLAMCLGLGIDALSRRWYSPALAAALFAAILSGYPVWTGAIVHTGVDDMPSMFVKLSQDWIDVAGRLNRTPGNESLLQLPMDPFYQMGYTWGYHGVDNIAPMLFHRNVLIPGAALTYFADARVETLTGRIVQMVRTGSPMLEPFLRTLGIRYVLYRADVLDATGGAVAPVPPSLKLALMHSRMTTFGKLTLFDLGPVLSPVRESADYIAGNYGPSFLMRDFVTLEAMEEPLARLQADDAAKLPRRPVAFERVGAGPEASARSIWRASDTPGSAVVDAPSSVGVRAILESKASIRIGRRTFSLPAGFSLFSTALTGGRTHVTFARRVPGLDILAAGTWPMNVTPLSAPYWRGPGFGTIGVAEPGIVTNGQLYNKYWVAVALGARATHLVVDGWQNGWYVDAPATLLVANVLNLVELAGILLAVAVLAFTGVRCFRR